MVDGLFYHAKSRLYYLQDYKTLDKFFVHHLNKLPIIIERVCFLATPACHSIVYLSFFLPENALACSTCDLINYKDIKSLVLKVITSLKEVNEEINKKYL